MRNQKGWFLVVGDLHLSQDCIDQQYSSIEAGLQVLARDDEFVRRCEGILVTGDNAGFDSPHRSVGYEREVLHRLALDFALFGPVYWLLGNHDPRGEYVTLGMLRHHGTGHEVKYVVDPACYTQGNRLIICWPWVHRTAVAPSMDWKAGVAEAYKSVLPAVDPGLLTMSSPMVLAHAALEGGRVRLGQPSVPTKDPVQNVDGLLDQWLKGTPDEGCPGVPTVICGHYHAAQQACTPGYGVPVIWPGSLFVHEAGESPRGKGLVVVDADTVEVVRRVEIAQPIVRALMEVDADGKVASFEPEDWRGGPVRVRVHLPWGAAAPVTAAQIEASLEGLATSVEMVPVYTDAPKADRDGAEQIAAEPDLIEKVDRVVALRHPEVSAQERAAVADAVRGIL